MESYRSKSEHAQVLARHAGAAIELRGERPDDEENPLVAQDTAPSQNGRIGHRSSFLSPLDLRTRCATPRSAELLRALFQPARTS